MTRRDGRESGRTASRADKLRGVYIGVVTANEGSGDRRYQVKLRFPWLPGGSDESHWARIAVPFAGADRGAYFLPDPDDQVLVVFEHGDIRRPIVVGALWSKKQPPPQKNSSGKNDVRVIKSRSGHRLIFDDKDGGERVVLADSTGENKIVLDSANDEVIVESARGDITIKAASGAARLHADGIKVATKGGFSAEGTKVQVATRGKLTARTSGTLALKGPPVQLNPDGYGGGGGGVGG